ncbi:ABC transporter ATP-binding protein [Terriglobus aquaticus]|uniref:ABC transporter ATP-binding protein n=1 Tax=Terriglobus aquaticus TaxID=940139 RepID=A0ABW9KK79_9BACT|nr:ABC transporter ATP-binding protein [Terriglobus aquaticus]
MTDRAVETDTAPLFIDLSAVSVMRGDAVVLHDIALEIPAGQCVAILGPNGCGKSTLVQTLTRELYPVVRPGMHVRIFGRERWDVTELRRRLGIVPSTAPPRDALGVPALEVVTAGFFSAARLWPNLRPTAEMREEAYAGMERLGIASLADRELGAMSAGQQKRVMIARALCSSGDGSGQRVLLLDEPSNALDLRAQHELRETLMRLAGDGVGLVLVTHHTQDIVPAFERVLMMQSGRIMADGTPSDLLTAEALSDLYDLQLQVQQRDDLYFAF